MKTSAFLFSRRDFLRHSSVLLPAGSLWLPAGTVAKGEKPHTGSGEAAAKPYSGKKLITRQQKPYNGEPALPALVRHWLTPTELFYVRNHAPVPRLSLDAFRLKVEGLVHQSLTFSLPQLQQRFRSTSVIATMTCAGNRRYEHSKVRKVGGVQWQEGAIGNARWGGVRLSEILKAAGLKPEARHIWFEGLDEIDRKGGVIPFGASIPLEKAMHDTPAMPGALICHQMNGQLLPPEHGYPLRGVVPGYIGARSVKWLGKIVVSNRPSPNHYQQGAYKLVTEDTPLDWAEAGPLYVWPLNSVIGTPSAGAKLKAGRVRVAGYALAPGKAGRTIRRVEVSADDGRSFIDAKLMSPRREFCWVLWTAEVTVTPQTQRLIVRCTDSAGQSQPREVPWNKKGYLYNAWHRLPVTVH